MPIILLNAILSVKSKLRKVHTSVLFCLFAEDTGIFDPEQFHTLVEDTREDGTDLGPRLAQFFEVLNQPTDQRGKNLPEEFQSLPYVNGKLFAEHLGFAHFTPAMRDALIKCCKFKWSQISPAVFGSLFQSIMADAEGRKKRRQGGAHYTTERDIMKAVRSLFLDELRAEFEKVKGSKTRLGQFHEKLGRLTFLDPACGCGNFLVITYRELRLLEIDVLKALHGERPQQLILHIDELLKVNVDQMYGIEIDEWPARIAEVAMWLMDHQMNQRVSETFGEPVLRLPLTKSATIAHANAIRMDWNDVIPATKCSYVLGNPPFVGKALMTKEQDADVEHVAGKLKGRGVLDYVTMWYLKAAAYIEKTDCRVAFVSSNSITQGEQVGIIWPELVERRGIKINFAHRTFVWKSDARGPAHVHVVIIGFAKHSLPDKHIYDYDQDEAGAVVDAADINPYLIDAPYLVITARSTPISAPKPIVFGSMPNDGGNLLLDARERADLITAEPAAEPFIKPILGSREFINAIPRWCLWLVDAQPSQLRKMPEVMKRVEAVKKHRLSSDRETTNDLANSPTLFGEIRQPATRYLAIPKTSSERRRYIPIGFLEPSIIATTELQMVEGATLYDFGILTSSMHMAWVRTVCGRLKSDYRYSNKLVYNNFPWPQDVSEKQRTAVERAAQAVLDARASYPGQSYADLYNRLAMPKPLLDAHLALDRLVERCYRGSVFGSDRERVRFLFAQYEKLTNLFASAKKPRKGKEAKQP